MAKYCKKCGARLDDDAAFCPKCGARMESAAQQQTNASAGRSRSSLLSRIIRLAVIVIVAVVAVKLLRSVLGGSSAGVQSGDYYTAASDASGQSFSTGAADDTGDDFVSWLLSQSSSSGSSYQGSANYSASATSGSAASSASAVAPQPVDINGLRDRYTALKGNGSDTVTIMVYMIGADLESQNGCATSDLMEMLKANAGEKVNIVVQTGGCSNWNNSVMTNGAVERWLINSGKLYSLESVGKVSMVKSDTVSDFIRYCAKAYPASRYQLIFWDHGGGSIMGYGSDENYSGSLMLSDIADALKAGSVKFDLVGYDACLMGAIENAYMLEPYADYLVASEELEPGSGWDYTGWLNAIGANTSIDTVALGKVIVDDFVAQNSASDTLSVVDLREIPYTYEILNNFMSQAEDALKNQQFSTLSTARAGARSYADGGYEMIDIIDMVRRTGLSEAQDVIDAVSSCVKYKNNCSEAGSYGLSMYFPYKALGYYSQTKSDMSKYGYGGKCMEFFDSFVNIMAGGQTRSSVSPVSADTYSGYDWYDPSAVSDSDYAGASVDVRALTEKNGGWVLQMTDEQWALVTDIQLQALVDDGECYLDLGSDQLYEFDEDGDLKVDYDNTWVAVDGQIVPYYAEKYVEDGDAWFCYGYSPAKLGDEQIEVILYWDQSHPSGYVAGYRPYSQDLTTAAKGLSYFRAGDAIQFLADGYDYDGNYLETYALGDPVTVTSQQALTVSYEDVGDDPVAVCFQLSDLYQNTFWTEFVLFGGDEK